MSSPVGAKSLSLKVSSERDWFEISGRITVEEGLVLEMQELLARLDQARGRFVPLDDGRFLALTADLKRQLQQLNAISDDAAHGRRVHRHAAMAMEGLIDDAGSVADAEHQIVAQLRLLDGAGRCRG